MKINSKFLCALTVFTPQQRIIMILWRCASYVYVSYICPSNSFNSANTRYRNMKFVYIIIYTKFEKDANDICKFTK